jgi:hypothetical protein
VSLSASAVALLTLSTLILVLRRDRGTGGTPCVRMEVVHLGAVAAGSGAFAGPAVPAVPATSQEPAGAPGADTPGGSGKPPPVRTLLAEEDKTFELGPTYEEEQRLLEEARRHQEEGLLRHVFEQNRALREQLGGAAAAGA